MSFRSAVPFVAIVLLSCSAEAPTSNLPPEGGEPALAEEPRAEEVDVDDDPIHEGDDEGPPEPAPVIAPVRPAADGDLLVWIHKEPAFTARIDGRTGEVLETIPEIQIATPGHTWTFAAEEKKLPAGLSCDDLLHDEGVEEERDEHAELARPESSTQRLMLTSGAEVRELEPFASDKEAADLAQMNHTAELVASVGPYAFVRAWTYADACGAHGAVGAEAHVIDVETGKQVNLGAELGAEQELAKVAATKIEDALDDELPQRTELLPDIGASSEGLLKIGRKFTAFACYACSDGDWSSYSRSVVLPGPRLPRSLVPFARLPEGLTRFRKENPSWPVGGFSVISALTAR